MRANYFCNSGKTSMLQMLVGLKQDGENNKLLVGSLNNYTHTYTHRTLLYSTLLCAAICIHLYGTHTHVYIGRIYVCVCVSVYVNMKVMYAQSQF